MSGRASRALLIVVSAPSGAGKTTLCDRLIAENKNIVYSISCTTRSPRGSEVDGRDYFFLTGEEFDRRVRDGCFLEHAVVHGYKYGTLRETVVNALTEGNSVLMDIDVQGADQVRNHVSQAPACDKLKEGFVDIFVEPPSMAVLRERLKGRGVDAADVIDRRLKNAEEEMKHRGRYRFRIVNDNINSGGFAFVSGIRSCR